MTSIVRNAVLLGLLVALAAACGSSTPSTKLLDARISLPLYPEAEARATGRPPPGFYGVDHPSHFTADAAYLVAITDGGERIQAFYKDQMPNLGWTLEDPSVSSSDEQLAGFCMTPGFVACQSYTKDDIRAIIITLTSFSLGAPTGGTGYQLHVEPK